MAGYRDAITTIAAQNKIAFDETELQALNTALQDPKTSAVDCAAAFEKFKQSIDEKLTSKMDSLNASIEESSDTLEKLGLSTTGLSAMKNSAEEAAEGVTKLALSTGNIKG
jgi:mevalonate kinase